MRNQDIQVSLTSVTPFERLIEYPVPCCELLDDRSTAYAFVPSVAGSAFFIDYKVDEPVPPNSMFIFKASCNTGSLATWDCTAKNGYKGRAQWGLSSGNHAISGGCTGLMRMLFTFPQDFPTSVDLLSHWIRIEVFRIEHRARLETDYSYDQPEPDNPCDAPRGVHLMPGGYLSKRNRKRQYRYQLLDAKDKPFAAFVFYYRPLDDLKRLGIYPGHLVRTSASFSWSGTSGSNSSISGSDADAESAQAESSELIAPATQPTTKSAATKAIDSGDVANTAQITPSRSPRKVKNRKHLQLTLSDGHNDPVSREKRALSPFGPGGFLRNRLSAQMRPHTAPPKILNFQDINECFEAQRAEDERILLRNDGYAKHREKNTVHKPMISSGQRIARERISGVIKGLAGRRLERMALEQKHPHH